MKKIILLSTLLGFLLCLQACTTLNAILPTAVVESPEIYNSSENGPRLILRTEPAQNFKLVADASARPLRIQNPPTMEPKGFSVVDPQKDGLVMGMPMTGLSFTPSSKFQWAVTGLPLAFWPSEYAMVLRGMVKYQWIGSPDSPHMLSTFAHLTWSYSHIAGNQRELFGAGGYPWQATANSLAPNIGISYGYQLNPSCLGYLGVAYQSFTMAAKVTQEVSATGDFPAAEASLPDSNGFSKILQLGLVLGEKKNFDLAYSFSETHWYLYQNQIHFLSLGFRL